MKQLIQRLLSRLAPAGEVIRARVVTDEQLIESLAVDADHPMFQAFLELIDRARNEARAEAKSAIKSERETLFALGGEHGMDKLEEYLINLRAEAARQRHG